LPTRTDLSNSVYGYDAEKDAELAIAAYLEGQEPLDEQTKVTARELQKLVGWWWPEQKPPPASRLVSASKL